MKIEIDGNEYSVEVEITGNRGADITLAARRLCEEQGINWRGASVFAQHGERGRCYTKQPGYVTLGAHG